MMPVHYITVLHHKSYTDAENEGTACCSAGEYRQPVLFIIIFFYNFL